MGWGIRMGNTCKSMADSCQCMTKTTTICKVISLQLIKINEKKKKKGEGSKGHWEPERTPSRQGGETEASTAEQ